MRPIEGTTEMIAAMKPVLLPGDFVFCSTRDDGIKAQAFAVATAFFNEDEGASFILPSDKAERFGFPTDLKMRQITLSVLSSLEGIGLTAAVSGALTRRGIPCNIVSATHHDHVFVPSDMADDAVKTLIDVQDNRAPSVG